MSSAAPSPTMEADEVEALLKKLKALGNAPQHAERKVVELDKTMTMLRTNRARMAAQIAADTALLEQLSKDEAAAVKAVKDLEAARDGRLASKKRILHALASCEKEVASFTLAASHTTTKTVASFTAHNSHYISSTLEASRGYSTKPGTTPGATVKLGSTASSSASLRS